MGDQREFSTGQYRKKNMSVRFIFQSTGPNLDCTREINPRSLSRARFPDRADNVLFSESQVPVPVLPRLRERLRETKEKRVPIEHGS